VINTRLSNTHHKITISHGRIRPNTISKHYQPRLAHIQSTAVEVQSQGRIIERERRVGRIRAVEFEEHQHLVRRQRDHARAVHIGVDQSAADVT